MKIAAFIGLTLIILVGSCSLGKSPTKQESRVDLFEYQGYGDTIVSLLYGEVYDNNESIPGLIPAVSISVSEDSASCVSNSKGEFTLGLPKGVFIIKISKPGYQTLLLSNYNSDPDRVSFTKIILVKGSGEIKYHIPDPK